MIAAGEGPLEGRTGGSDREIVAEASDDASVHYQPEGPSRRFALVGSLIRHLVGRQQIGALVQVPAARG